MKGGSHYSISQESRKVEYIILSTRFWDNTTNTVESLYVVLEEVNKDKKTIEEIYHKI